MLLACRLKITFTSSLKLITSFFGINILLPSLDSHSFLVRVSMLLFLFSSCCISILGPRAFYKATFLLLMVHVMMEISHDDRVLLLAARHWHDLEGVGTWDSTIVTEGGA
jgi:hypothetical protein